MGRATEEELEDLLYDKKMGPRYSWARSNMFQIVDKCAQRCPKHKTGRGDNGITDPNPIPGSLRGFYEVNS